MPDGRLPLRRQADEGSLYLAASQSRLRRLLIRGRRGRRQLRRPSKGRRLTPVRAGGAVTLGFAPLSLCAFALLRLCALTLASRTPHAARRRTMTRAAGAGLEGAFDAVRHASQAIDGDAVEIRGCDLQMMGETASFSEGPDRLSQLLASFMTTGFQATNLAKAIDQVNAMRAWTGDEGQRCRIFLGYTSNQVSCGNREIIRYLVEHKMVDVIVTTAGGIEEDLIKCLKPTVLGDFALDGRTLRGRGLNRIGNLIVPNVNYCAFEDWLVPILDAMVQEQAAGAATWSPSSVIKRLGKEINDPASICYWAHLNDIPIFSPALTDGSLGDMLYFHSYKNAPERQLIIDIVRDVRLINNLAVRAPATGIICLGGGVVKHHICNANLMRNGADFAVFINTGCEFDGSDSGASPDEAISWGKIKSTATPVKVCTDASIAFPLLVAETFAKDPIMRRSAAQRELSKSLYL